MRIHVRRDVRIPSHIEYTKNDIDIGIADVACNSLEQLLASFSITQGYDVLT